jgi:hypothetical protein
MSNRNPAAILYTTDGDPAGTSADPLRVDPTGTTTQPVSGTVTANAGTNLNTSALALESGGNLATVAGAVKAEDAASASGHTGIPALAIQQATPADTAGTDGDYAMLQMSAGRVWTSATIDSALPAGSNAIGKLAANNGVDIGDVTINNAAGGSAVNIQDGGNSITVDGTVSVSGTVATSIAAGATTIAKAEDAASADADVGVPAMAVRKASPANTSGTDGDYEMLQMSAGRLWTSSTIDAALPAGTNAIGKLAANDGVDIGDVTINNGSGGSAVNIQDGGNSITVDGSVTANIGTTNGLALDASITAQSLVDNAGFTDGTTRVQPAGFIFDEVAGTALTENDAAAARIDSKRAQIGVIEDATTRGQRASVSAAGALKVDGSAVTQPVSGTITANIGTSGSLALDATLAKLTVAQGASLGSNTQALAGGSVTTAAPSYTTGQVSPLSLTTAGSLRVDIGASTVSVGAGATSIGKAEDVASADADVGVPAMAIRKASPANTSGTDGDYEMLQMSAGRLWTSATIDAALPAGTNAIGKLAANDGVDIGDVTINNAAGGSAVNIQDGGNSITVDGTVTANIGTTNGLALDATLSAQSLVDNAAFTDGTSRVQPAGFIFDEVAGTALTENDVAAARVNSNRAQIGVIEDGATRARYATVTASNALKVDGSAVTQPVSGTITANIGTSGSLALDATLAKLTVAQGASLGSNTQALMGGSVTTAAPTYSTGQISPLSLTTGGALRVDMGSSSFTADTELPAAATIAADGVAPTVPGIAAYGFVKTPGANTWDRAASVVNATNSTGTGIAAAGLVAQFDDTTPTAITENQFGNVRMSANRNLYGTIRDAAGNERGANVNASNQLSVSVDNTVTVAAHNVTNAGTFAVQATVAAAATNIAKAEDAASADADVGVPAMAVRKATPANTSGTDGDYEMLQMSAGRLWTSSTIDNAAGASAVNIQDGGNSITVDGSVTATIAAGATSIGKAEDVAFANADVGVPAMAIRRATPANESGTDGDYEMLQMSAGRLWTSTTIDAALPAGTNAIGKLAANSGVDIGDVDVLSVVPGTGATNLGKAEDAAHTTGDTGVMALGVRSDAGASGNPTALATTTGDYIPLATDANNRLYTNVAGDIAHDSADSTSAPVKIGGQARTTNPTAVADADRVNAIFDKVGRMAVVLGQVRELVTHQHTQIVNSTTETTILTAGASGVFHDLTSLILTNASSTACTVTIKDATTGTTRMVLALAANGGAVINFPRPVVQAVAASNWTATLSVNTVTVNIFAQAEKNV